MSQPSSTAIPIVFGAMTFGNGTEQSRVSSLSDCGQMLDIFQSHGHSQVDTARIYGEGSSESYLGQLHHSERGLSLATKIYPTAGLNVDTANWTHRPAHIREALMQSLQALGTRKIHLYYLHGPDRNTPFVDTLREINALHREGYFEKFGLSNFMSWEVAQICQICDANGWIQPSVYQGVYNPIQRVVEPELMACLRYYGISFYAYSPLAGGFFTGGFQKESDVSKGSRFDPEKFTGKTFRARYWNDTYFAALDLIKPVAEQHGLTMAEVALRWMTHHSKLARESNDAIIVGASSATQLQRNLVDLEKGPLPGDIVEALDQAWRLVKGLAPQYWH